MRILDIRERSVPISRHANGAGCAAPLTTSAVAVVTDLRRGGEPVIGYGFASIGRFAQGGLIRERFAPRLRAAHPDELRAEGREHIDPMKAWSVMMHNEKCGGHGERCVAVGALDMALWDAAAKAVEQPLARFLAARTGAKAPMPRVPVYAGGGYYFADRDIGQLQEETGRFLEAGFNRVKIKIGSVPLAQDLARIDAVLSVLGRADRLAVDATNSFSPQQAQRTADALAPYGLRWFEDICDPLDFETHAAVARRYAPPLSAGEALFSLSDARNLMRYGGLRPGHDVLTFDPAHCYGLPEYLRIIRAFEQAGWSRRDFQPHGGHLFSLHVAAALGLGGCECNPHNFQPFGGFAGSLPIERGTAAPPAAPGIGFETRPALMDLFRSI